MSKYANKTPEEMIWHLNYTCYGCKKKKTFQDGQPTKMKHGKTKRKVTICPECAEKNKQGDKA